MQQFETKHSSSPLFYFLLRLSHTQKQKSKSIFPITVAKHGGARGDIGGFMQGFDIKCPRGIVDVEYATVDDARRRSRSHPFR